MTTGAALLYCGATAFAIAFQFALAAGAPWGAWAMGGRFPGRLPPAMRFAAVGQALILGLLAVVVLARAGLVHTGWEGGWRGWAVVAFSAVSLLMNLATPSKVERRLWAPVALLLLASSLTVALAA